MQALAEREVRTFCRICTGHCGLILTLDDAGQPVSARGDRDDPHSIGYICSKGAASPQMHTDGGRLLHPLKRMEDGSFVAIPLEQALDEIAAKLGDILDRHGPDAIAGFRGTGGFFTTAGLPMLPGFLTALGSHKLYTTLTIDQSAKVVAAYRIGIWPPGKQTLHTADVSMMIGGNPMVSMAQLDTRNPVKRMAAQKKRGLKLIVIDPRRTETAALADLFVQPLPGNDAAIAAALLRIVLERGWHDADFCAEHVGDLDALRSAVEPFAVEAVAARADVAPEQLIAVADLFARQSRRGVAVTGTGVDMGPHSNLAEHLVECLNVICGRFIRAGETIPNPGFVTGRGPKPAQVLNLPRPWDSGPQSRLGDYGLVGGEMVTGMLAEDILRPGPGQVRFLLNHGGNPASAVPDQRKMTRALRSLDLLVSIDPVMSATARLSHYILPPALQFERADLPIYLFESATSPIPYSRYTPAMVPRPAGSDLCDEWQVPWALAARLGRAIDFMGKRLEIENPPTEDDLIAITLQDAPVTLEVLRAHPYGYFDAAEHIALPADPATAGRFTLVPDDVRDEVAALRADFAKPHDDGFAFRLICRRARHRMNSIGLAVPDLVKMMPFNPASMNPADMADLDMATGDRIDIRSGHGAISAVVQADETLRRGVVSLSHGFGALSDDGAGGDAGVSSNRLISTETDLQTINAMPLMTAIPVALQRSDARPA